MSSISSTNGAAFLQSMASSSTAGGNWVQDSTNATTNNADWMDPSASGPDTTDLAANAMAAAHQIQLTNQNSLAVSKGISVLSAQLTGSVNILA
jgi:hypothetical protein